VSAWSLAAAGCTNTSQWGYDIWNYSTNHYVVRLTFQDGTARVAAVPPNGIVSSHTQADPRQAVVYDQTCSLQVATLQLSGHWAYIVIDPAAAMSADSSARLHADTDPPYATSEPIPSTCPNG
jgi:hypothetical protein